MHELSLAMSVKEIVEEAALANNASSVNEILIVVGEFSSVSVDALEFAMDVAKRDSVFENAKITMKSEKTVLTCSDCGKETVMDDYVFRCGHCGSVKVLITSGDRMYVESIDIERKEQ